MRYIEFLNELLPFAEEEFAAFQRKLVFTERTILGIRTPALRKIAKNVKVDLATLLSYPNEYYEVVFIKLTVLSSLPYEEFIRRLEEGLALVDNWALCDGFKANCIKESREEFLPVLEKMFQSGKEYFVRYVFVTLLTTYMEEEYLPHVRSFLERADCSPYYVHMAAAWLTAEVLIKHYEEGVALLKSGILPAKTHDKSIQKAIESYRLTNEQKEYLRSLKINQRKR